MRVNALVLRIIQQFLRDRRTLALLLLAPLLILTLMKLVFDGQSVSLDIGTYKLPQAVMERLQISNANVIAYETLDDAKSALEDETIDALVSLNGSQPSVTLEGSDPSTSKAVILLLQNTLNLHANDGNALSLSYLHGSAEMAPFDSFGPVLIGFFSFFFVFLLAGVSFLRERTSGTLERLLATPIRRQEIVAGYLAGFGIFALLQATLIAWYSVKVLGLYMTGSIGYMLLINLLLALTALTLGTLLSSFASTEFQIIQFIPIVIVPQAFFSGLFNLDAMNPWLQKLSSVMPLYYGADAMRGIMIRGEGWPDIQQDAYILIGFSAIFAILNVLALRKHRHL